MLHTDQKKKKCKSTHYIKYLYSYLLNRNLWMKVRGKNVFFLPHVSFKIWGADVQFGTFLMLWFCWRLLLQALHNFFFLNMT